MDDARNKPEKHRTLRARYLGSTRDIVALERTGTADTRLGLALTFVAGAINAGGFLAIGQYTSHMSGILSAMADHAASGAFDVVLFGLMAFLPFIIGAACSAMLINWGRNRRLGGLFALPLLLEALLLIAFGVLGWLTHPSAGFMRTAVPLLCFIMGLQNATVTKISGARMRTTHVTGIVTDIGIELGKLFYWNRDKSAPPVMADRAKLRLLAALLTSFFVGGVVGAIGFSQIGFLFALPFAFVLLILAGPALVWDLTKHH